MNTPTTCPKCGLACDYCLSGKCAYCDRYAKPEAPAREMRVQYSGKRFGKSMQMAMDLAEKAKQFTSVKISVMPHEDFEQMRRERDEAWDCVTETKKRSSDRALEIDRLRAELIEAKATIEKMRDSSAFLQAANHLLTAAQRLHDENAAMKERAEKAENINRDYEQREHLFKRERDRYALAMAHALREGIFPHKAKVSAEIERIISGKETK